MSLSKEKVKKVFLIFQTIWLKKWTDNFPSSEILDIALEQWRKGLNGLDDALIEKGVDYCRVNLVWPPSIAEFIDICDKADGLPNTEEIIRLAIARQFTHPIVQMIFDEITSYAFSILSADVLHKKVSKLRKRILENYREQRSNQNIQDLIEQNGEQNDNQLQRQKTC